MSGRLPAYTPADVIRALLRAGFEHHHTRGSHRYYWHAGQRRMVAVAFHRRDLKRGTLTAIIKQAGLTVEEFTTLLRDPTRDASIASARRRAVLLDAWSVSGKLVLRPRRWGRKDDSRDSHRLSMHRRNRRYEFVKKSTSGLGPQTSGSGILGFFPKPEA